MKRHTLFTRQVTGTMPRSGIVFFWPADQEASVRATLTSRGYTHISGLLSKPFDIEITYALCYAMTLSDLKKEVANAELPANGWRRVGSWTWPTEPGAIDWAKYAPLLIILGLILLSGIGKKGR